MIDGVDANALNTNKFDHSCWFEQQHKYTSDDLAYYFSKIRALCGSNRFPRLRRISSFFSRQRKNTNPINGQPKSSRTIVEIMPKDPQANGQLITGGSKLNSLWNRFHIETREQIQSECLLLNRSRYEIYFTIYGRFESYFIPDNTNIPLPLIQFMSKNIIMNDIAEPGKSKRRLNECELMLFETVSIYPNMRTNSIRMFSWALGQLFAQT